MAAIDERQWRALSPHFDHALELTESERITWLAALAREDPALARDLEALLTRHAQAARAGFLENSVAIPSPISATPASFAGRTFGAYTIESPLGRGGMGSVWLARRSDGRFEGRVAIKLLNLALVGAEGSERFRREGSILARLSHPNIARMLDAGVTADGQPYLVLEHVEGEPIDQYCDAHNLDVSGRIRLMLGVLDAVAHAHRHLILHRDLKPSNILVAADGTPKLLDFGIAKVLEDAELPGAETALTRAGGHAFTLEYAAPEQVQGRAVTTATDVYALGVLLYELLGGLHPTRPDAGTPVEQLKAIVETEPRRLDVLARVGRSMPADTLMAIAARRGTTLQRLRRTLRGDPGTIVAKALKKDPKERYATASAFSDDLRRYLADEPVAARPDSRVYRAAKFVRRHRLGVSAACVTSLALLGGVAGVSWQAHAAQAQRDRALRELTRAESANLFMARVLGTMSADGKPFTTVDLLERGEELVDRLFAKDPALRAEMLLALGARYRDAGVWERAERLTDRSAAMARQIGAPVLEATANCQLAGIRNLSNAYDEAVLGELAALADRALVTLAAAGDAPVEARCHVIRSDIRTASEDFNSSIQQDDKALALLAGAGPLHLDIAIDALSSKAWSLRQMALTTDARRTYDRALALTTEAGLDGTTTMAKLLVDAGWTLYAAGADRDAATYYERALVHRSRDHPSEDVPAELALGHGLILADAGRLAEAVAWFRQGIATAKVSGANYYETSGLIFTAGALLQSGDIEGAENALDGAVAVSPYPEGDLAYANVALLQAQIARARGDLSGARDLFAESLRLYEQQPSPRGTHAFAETRLASLLIQLGDLDAARAHAEQGLVIARKVASDLPASRYTGLAWLAIADVRRAQGDDAGAHVACESALAQLEPAIGTDATDTRRARACNASSNASGGT